MAAEFDAYVDEYDAQHRASIRLSGEDPAYFAEYKVQELRRLATLEGMDAPTVIDFGSGLGNSIPAFRRHFPASHVTQADVSKESLACARRLHGGREPQLLIKENRIPVPDGAYDLAFVACVFHHIPEAEHGAVLRELRRVVRPGGRVVIFEHNPFNPLTRHAVANCPFDRDAVLIDARTMTRRLRDAGWKAPCAQFHVFVPSILRALRRVEPWLRWCPIGAQYAAHAVAP